MHGHKQLQLVDLCTISKVKHKLKIINCQRAAEAKRSRLRGGSIIEPRIYLDVQGEKISSDPEKR